MIGLIFLLVLSKAWKIALYMLLFNLYNDFYVSEGEQENEERNENMVSHNGRLAQTLGIPHYLSRISAAYYKIISKEEQEEFIRRRNRLKK